MRYQSTVFGQLLKAVPRGWFERTARSHHSGRAKRSLPAWSHMVAMTGAHLCGVRSLRDLERVLERHSGILPHLGVRRVARSTLADANAARPAALFEAVAGRLCEAVAARKLGREGLRLIDATRLVAGKSMEAWARGAVKLHLALDPEQQSPTWFAVTQGRVNDITAARHMPIEPGLTYVFDKGYYDFSFWAALQAQGCRFVTRLKKNSPTRLVRERKPRGGNILFDRTVRLSERLSGQRRNPFREKLRIIGVRIDNGREITLLTNDLKSRAETIDSLYTARWQVELFFKWVKQNLRLDHFLGHGQNASIIQIMAALTAYLLLRLASLNHAASLSLQAFARLMPTMAFTRRPLSEIFAASDPPASKGANVPTQLQLALA
jgi:hypothetical protein